MTRSRRARILFLPIASLAAVILAAGPAYAAPTYESSDPEAGAKLHEAPDQVSVTFSEPLDPSSSLLVRDECGRRLDDGQVEVMIDTMTVGIARTPSGRYDAFYLAKGIAGLTGQTEDSFSFVVHAGSPCEAATGDGHAGHGGDGGGGGTGGAGGGPGSDHGDHTDDGQAGDGAAHDAHEGADDAGTDLHQGHPGASGSGPRQQGRGRGREPGRDGDASSAPSDSAPPFADAPGGPAGDGGAALTAALALAAAFGVLGGLYLRVLDRS